MPWGLRRYQQTQQLHFITFSCYRRLPYLQSPQAKRMFEIAFEEARARYGLLVFGYVVMPEHVHFLVSEPDGWPIIAFVWQLWDSESAHPASSRFSLQPGVRLESAARTLSSSPFRFSALHHIH